MVLSHLLVELSSLVGSQTLDIAGRKKQGGSYLNRPRVRKNGCKFYSLLTVQDLKRCNRQASPITHSDYIAILMQVVKQALVSSCLGLAVQTSNKCDKPVR